MVIYIQKNKCQNCHVCQMVSCPAGDVKRAYGNKNCINCGACVLACPFEAITNNNLAGDLNNDSNRKDDVDNYINATSVKVMVNGQELWARGLVKDALNLAGIKITKSLPESHSSTEINDIEKNEQIFMPCECGGCWACVVEVNGLMALSCITPLADQMNIKTLSEIKNPLRIVSGFGVHTVGGVGTPYYLKNNSRPIEVVGFTHGCNLRCPQCQNNPVAFTGSGNLLDPEEAAQILLGLQNLHEVDTITLSGGESTLNRQWLIQVIKNIRNQDKQVKIHIDTNGTILTPKYIDDLVKSGMNQIGLDLKGMKISTFQGISGLEDHHLAAKYLKNSWKCAEYIINNYDMGHDPPRDNKYSENNLNNFYSKYNGNKRPKKDISANDQSQNNSKLFLGIGIPYNKSLISKLEIKEMGSYINDMDPAVQVCVLDYRPEFRRRDIIKPTVSEMMEIKNILNDQGLKTVIVQTEDGILGP